MSENRKAKKLKYIIWGAGSYGRMAIAAVGKENTIAFLDSDENKIGKSYCGKKIISFEQYRSEYRNYILLIAIRESDACIEILQKYGIYTYLKYKDIPSELFRNVGREELRGYILSILQERTLHCVKGWGLYGLILYDWIVSVNRKCCFIFDTHIPAQMISLLDMYGIDYIFDEQRIFNLPHVVLLCKYVRKKDLTMLLHAHPDYYYVFDCMDKIEAYYNPKLEYFRNLQKGKRCFIVATGPSLRMEDLDVLGQKQEICFSMNTVYKAFDKTNWRPNYYMVSDADFILAYRDIIDALDIRYKFIGDQCPEFWKLEHDERIIKYHYNASDRCYDFAQDITKGCYAGHTITYICIQFAVYMGFEEIYLLGVDCNYEKGSKHNHFIEEDAEDYLEHRADKMLEAYQSAKEYADTHGIKIYNATRGGALEVFERVDFDTLFDD